MSKKLLSSITAAALAVTTMVTVALYPASAAKISVEEKLSADLVEELDKVGEDDLNLVEVHLNVTHEEYLRQAEFIGAKPKDFVDFYEYKDNYNGSGDLREIYNEWQKEEFCSFVWSDLVNPYVAQGIWYAKFAYYEQYLSDFVKDYDLEKYYPEFLYPCVGANKDEGIPLACAVLYFDMPKSVIYQIAEDDRVILIDKSFGAVGNDSDGGYYHNYTSEDSLRILRASVGLEEKHWGIMFDVDQDGFVNSKDALQALRVSVNLDMVGVPRSGSAYPLFDPQKYDRYHNAKKGYQIHDEMMKQKQ